MLEIRAISWYSHRNYDVIRVRFNSTSHTHFAYQKSFCVHYRVFFQLPSLDGVSAATFVKLDFIVFGFLFTKRRRINVYVPK